MFLQDFPLALDESIDGANQLGGIPPHNRPTGNVFRNNRAGSNNTIVSDGYSAQNNASSADKAVVPNGRWGALRHVVESRGSFKFRQKRGRSGVMRENNGPERDRRVVAYHNPSFKGYVVIDVAIFSDHNTSLAPHLRNKLRPASVEGNASYKVGHECKNVN
jgi:hypothetical protein